MGCSWAQDVYAGATIEERVRASMERDKLVRLKGWKRLIFLCWSPERSASKAMFDRMCDRTNTNVKFLAATANTPVRIARNAIQLGELGTLEGMLRLQVEIYPAKCDGSTCFIHADVSASFPYDKAIDLSADSSSIDENDRQSRRDSPASVPRPIQAFMWGPRALHATGAPGEELTGVVASGLDSLLKEFFTDYITANRE
jgi:hypothetical protein